MTDRKCEIDGEDLYTVYTRYYDQYYHINCFDKRPKPPSKPKPKLKMSSYLLQAAKK